MFEAEAQRTLLLAEKTAIVTGAGSGIGRGVALEMAHEGARVLLVDINQQGLDETEDTIRSSGGTCFSTLADVREVEEHQRIVNLAHQHTGHLDILINNAGVNTPGPGGFLEVTPEAFDVVFQTNVRGSFFLAQCVARDMLAHQQRGSLIFTSSTHARVTYMQPAYSASKAAIETLVRELALSLSGHGIRVNAVAPGWIDVRGQTEHANAFVPLGHSGLPQDIAQAMVFLASDQASYITGHTLTVDGGFSLPHIHYWQYRGGLPTSLY